jgi:hypothetical protein
MFTYSPSAVFNISGVCTTFGPIGARTAISGCSALFAEASTALSFEVEYGYSFVS